jgi:hydrogenase maturation protease
MKTLILALGNPILSDDGVAHIVADRLKKRLGSSSAGQCVQYDFIKSSAATMDIVPHLASYDRLVVIDAVQLGCSPPGTVHRLNLDDFACTIRPSSPHDVNFATAIHLGRQWGYHIPRDVRIYGIEAKELRAFSEHCTEEVAEHLDQIVEDILDEL